MLGNPEQWTHIDQFETIAFRDWSPMRPHGSEELRVLTDDATFTLDLHEVDRVTLLQDAAAELAVLSGHYGDGEAAPEPAETRLARLLAEEFAEFPQYPDVLEITAADFAASGRSPPLSFTRRVADHGYFWMRLPLALRPKLDWAFSRLELAIELNPGDDGDPRLRPIAYAILPHRRFQDVFHSHAQLEVSFDGNFELSAGVPTIALDAIGVPASAGAEVGGRMGAGLGVSTNYEWRLKRAQIDHTETGHARVFWRIDGTEFFAEDVPTPIVVIQVPRAVERLEVAAALQAYRHISLLNAGLAQKVLGLPGRLRDFFVGGSPLRDERSWDLTPVLEPERG